MSNSSSGDMNTRVIDEFRENAGEVGGVFEGAPLLLLHHTGAKTGKQRVTPLMYQDVEDGYAIFCLQRRCSGQP